jgi:hypothetical protein
LGGRVVVVGGAVVDVDVDVEGGEPVVEVPVVEVVFEGELVLESSSPPVRARTTPAVTSAATTAPTIAPITKGRRPPPVGAGVPFVLISSIMAPTAQIGPRRLQHEA